MALLPATASVASGFLARRTALIYPSLRCNLACSHCCTGASPLHGPGLPAKLWQHALPRLRAEGYTHIHVSGGEPLLYAGLAELLAVARGEGLHTSLVSNGLLADGPQGALLDQVDDIAISFDGLVPRHNAWRGRDDAFALASDAVARLAQRGRPVGAAITVGGDGLAALPELAAHLVRQGARALFIRPLAATGRAQGLADAAPGQGSDGLHQNRQGHLHLHLAVLSLQQALAPQVQVPLQLHGGLATARQLWRQRAAYARLLAPSTGPADARPSLSDLVNPLVVNELGIAKPLAYHFHPHFSIGHLNRLDEAWLQRYARVGVSALQRLVGSRLDQLARSPGVVDWFDLLARASAQQPVAGQRPLPLASAFQAGLLRSAA